MPAWTLGEELEMPGTPHRPAPVPTLEKIIGKDNKPTTDFVRYLIDVPNAGFEGTGGKVPIGTIVMFGGLVDAIPPGWEICDGNNDTPNLIDKFILGTVTEEEIGDTGGYAAPQMPAHVHTQTSHTHTIATHTHTIWHYHTINNHNHQIDHDHAVFHTAHDGSHTHSYDNYPVQDGVWSMPDDVTGWSHNSPWAVGQTTGGDSTHDHEVDIPNYDGWSAEAGLVTEAESNPDSGSGGTPNTGGATAANTGSTGAGDETLGNYPPYYKLIYIMRTV